MSKKIKSFSQNDESSAHIPSPYKSNSEQKTKSFENEGNGSVELIKYHMANPELFVVTKI